MTPIQTAKIATINKNRENAVCVGFFIFLTVGRFGIFPEIFLANFFL
jgi:hypothetical protein